jgi:hypothetical protein
MIKLKNVSMRSSRLYDVNFDFKLKIEKKIILFTIKIYFKKI